MLMKVWFNVIGKQSTVAGNYLSAPQDVLSPAQMFFTIFPTPLKCLAKDHSSNIPSAVSAVN